MLIQIQGLKHARHVAVGGEAERDHVGECGGNLRDCVPRASFTVVQG